MHNDGKEVKKEDYIGRVESLRDRDTSNNEMNRINIRFFLIFLPSL